MYKIFYYFTKSVYQINDLTFIVDGESSGSAKPISSIGVKRKTEGTETTSPKKAHLQNGGDAK